METTFNLVHNDTYNKELPSTASIGWVWIGMMEMLGLVVQYESWLGFCLKDIHVVGTCSWSK